MDPSLERLAELRVMPYVEYLQSPEWRAKREEALKENHRCSLCWTLGGPLQVHHLNYDNIGKENVEDDVTTLCRKCHEVIHNIDGKRDWLKKILAYWFFQGWHEALKAPKDADFSKVFERVWPMEMIIDMDPKSHKEDEN